MTAKKLLVLFLSVVFLFGSAGLAAAAEHEKKADAKKTEKMETKAAKAKNADGTVKAASADSLTVVGKGNKEWMFSVDAKTSIKKAGKAITAADLKAGDPVHVRFTEAKGKMMAQAITVKAGGTAKKTEKKAENPCAPKK